MSFFRSQRAWPRYAQRAAGRSASSARSATNRRSKIGCSTPEELSCGQALGERALALIASSSLFFGAAWSPGVDQSPGNGRDYCTAWSITDQVAPAGLALVC